MIWAMMAARGKAFAYYLRGIFAGVPNQTFRDGQVLDNTGEIAAGSLKVTDTSTGSVSISSGVARIAGDDTFNKTGLVGPNLVTREAGRLFYSKWKSSSMTRTQYPLEVQANVNNPTASPIDCALVINSVGEVYVWENAGVGPLMPFTLTPDTEYETIFELLSPSGYMLFMKGGTEFPVWTLVYVGSYGNTANLTIAAQAVITPNNLDILALQIPETLYTDQITPVFSLNLVGAAGTLLSSVTPTYGSYVTAPPVEWELTGDNSAKIATSAPLIRVINPLNDIDTNYFIEYSVIYRNHVTATFYNYGYTKLFDNFNFVYWAHDSFTDLLKIISRVATVDTILDSDSFPYVDDVEYTFKVRFDDAACSIYVDDVLRVSASVDTSTYKTDMRLYLRGDSATTYIELSGYTIYKASGLTFDLSGDQLLDADFSTLADETLVDGQVLDDVGEGLLDGSLTVNTIGTGSASIVGGELVLVGDNTAWDSAMLLGVEFYSREAGRGLYWKYKLELGSISAKAMCGWAFGTSGISQRLHTIANNLIDDLGIYAAINSTTYVPVGVFVPDVEYEFMIVLETVGAVFFIRGGIYTEWTFLYVGGINTNAVIPMFNVINNTDNTFAEIKVPDRLYTNQITPVFYDEFDGDAGAIDATRIPNVGSYSSMYQGSIDALGNAFCNVDGSSMYFSVPRTRPDNFIEFNFKPYDLAPLAVGFYIYIRLMAGNNWIRLQFFSTATATFTLQYMVDGVLQTDLDSNALPVLTNGQSYNMKIRNNGVDDITVYLDDVVILQTSFTDHIGTQVYHLAYMHRYDIDNLVLLEDYKINDVTGYTFEGID